MALDGIDRSVQSKAKTNFRTLALVFPTSAVATFVRSRAMKASLAFAWFVCLVLMAGCPLFLFYGGFFKSFGRDMVTFLVIFEAIALVVLVLFTVMFFTIRPLVFDRSQGRFWRKGKADRVIGDSCPLEEVEAVQVCSEQVIDSETDKPSYTAYELNVVLKRPSGRRVSAICHGDRDGLFADAHKLAEFLGVPLLNHTNVPDLGDLLPLT